MKNKTTYVERDGKLIYECGGRKKTENFPYIKGPDIKGEVPEEIWKRGVIAVRKYVEKEIKRAKAVLERFKKFGKNPNVPVSVRHKGVLLEGKIIYANARYIRVRLEKPEKYGGESCMNFRYHPVFEKCDEPKLTRDAIEGAQTVLAWIYDEKKHKENHKDLLELVEELNRE